MLTCLPNALFYHLQLASLIGSFSSCRSTAYTSLSLMRKNEYVWRQAMPYLLSVMFFVPLIVIGNLFYSKCRYEPFYRYTTFTYGLGSQAVQKNMEKHQWNFALICLSRFITDATFVAYAFTSYLLTNSGTDSPLRNVNFYFYTINDILSVTPGIVLLVGSKKAREVVFGKKLLHFYSSNKSNSTLGRHLLSRTLPSHSLSVPCTAERIKTFIWSIQCAQKPWE
ncbi:hypothetical protein M3Y99_01261400 [Aphelenchoides fujianensis]|nr:hypothetical protein M3Y99_01261400 [Aphelenchoides fujianensis]